MPKEWVLAQPRDEMGAALFTTGPYLDMAIHHGTPMSPTVVDGVVTWAVPLGTPQPPRGGFVANSARNRRSPAHRARRRRPLRPVDLRQPGAGERDGPGGGDGARTLWGASGSVLAGHGEASAVHPDRPRDVLRCVSCDKVDGGVRVKTRNGYDVQGEFYGVLEPVA